MISDAIMLVRNIDKAHLGSDVEPELRDPNFETSGDSLHSRNRGQKEAQTAAVRPGARLAVGLGREGVGTG